MNTTFDTRTNVIAGPGAAPEALAGASVAAAPAKLRLAAARRRLRRPLRRLIVPILLLGLWQVAASAGWINVHNYASPVLVANAFWQLSGNGVLWAALGASLKRAGLGLALGLAVGLTLGVIAGLSHVGEDAIDTTMQMLRTLPFLALVPLFILWFGIDELPKVLLVALACVFPMYVNTFAGIRGVDRKLIELADTVGLSRLQLIRRVLVPGALPSVLVGLRYSLAFSVLALVAAEQINASSGLGALIVNAQNYFETNVLILVVVIYMLLGVLVDVIVRVLDRLLLSWRVAFDGERT
jgi:sulfonate transport system permease protein